MLHGVKRKVWLIWKLSTQERYALLEIIEKRVNGPKSSMILCTQYNDEEWYGRIDPEYDEGSPVAEAIMGSYYKQCIWCLHWRKSLNEKTSWLKVKNGRKHFMMKECPFNSRNRCEIWTDYQVACVALQEEEELCSSNWEEISYLLDKIEILEARLIEAGIPIPE